MKIMTFTAITAAVAAGAALLMTTAGITDAGATGYPYHTVTRIVRPVRADGTLAPGWRVRTETGTAVTCTTGASVAAVDDDIRGCGNASVKAPSCWKSTSKTVLCLVNPSSVFLARYTLKGSFAPVAARAHRVPQGVALHTGYHCTLTTFPHQPTVVGHPTWKGFYGCGGVSLFGPAKDAGLDGPGTPWFAHVGSFGPETDSVRVRDTGVSGLYYVGTA